MHITKCPFSVMHFSGVGVSHSKETKDVLDTIIIYYLPHLYQTSRTRASKPVHVWYVQLAYFAHYENPSIL
jgi:hypothetical protein